jgi:DNA-binding transcriptional LysR family regulator
MAVEEFFAQHGLAPNVRMELGSNEAIKHAVAAGLGCAILSRYTLGRDPRRDGLALLAVEHLPIRRTWYLVQREGRVASPVVRAFVEDVGRRLAARAAGGAGLGAGLSAGLSAAAARRPTAAARSSGSAPATRRSPRR